MIMREGDSGQAMKCYCGLTPMITVSERGAILLGVNMSVSC